jgi:hypothetical protein
MDDTAIRLKRNRHLLVLAGFALLLFCLWQLGRGRYEFIHAGGVVLYRVDRWTGEILYIHSGEARKVRVLEPPGRGIRLSNGTVLPPPRPE